MSEILADLEHLKRKEEILEALKDLEILVYDPETKTLKSVELVTMNGPYIQLTVGEAGNARALVLSGMRFPDSV